MDTVELLFKPARLSVVSSTYAEFAGPWPEEPGVRLFVIVTATKRLVTGIWTDSGQSELFTLSDDTGRDLLQEGGGDSAVGPATDHKGGLFEICGPVPPAATASRISACGRILISTAEGTETHRSAVVPAKAGATATVRGLKFTVGSVEKSEYGDSGLEIEFHRHAKEQELRGVCRFRFEDENGQPIETQELISSRRGSDDEFELTDRLMFPERVRQFVVAVEFWIGRVETSADYTVSSTIGCDGVAGALSPGEIE